MSLINQVLKDLDKRGATTQIGEATIRVVHYHNGRNVYLLIALGVTALLAVGGVLWMASQKQQQAVFQAVVAQTAVPVAEILPASQPLVAPVQQIKPSIESIVPDPVMATGLGQIITVKGDNFKAGMNVTLRDGGGQVYENRPILSLTQDQIELKLNLGKKASNWTVEVLDADGLSSGRFNLAVKTSVMKGAETKIVESRTNKKSAPTVSVITSDSAIHASAEQGVVIAPGINKQPTQISPQQQAENEFRKAYALIQQGQSSAGMNGLEVALQLDPGHLMARQTLTRLLIENKRNAEAEKLLQDGINNDPKQTSLALLLARLQVGRNELPQALETMQKSLPYAQTQADYVAFVAALLQRQNRHSEAIIYFQKAVQLNQQSGVWLMGLGISLREQQRKEEARDAFNRALLTNSLNAELKSFVTQQLKDM